ncbi:MAG: amidohydrolase family protein [Neisseriaceae bacterium]|nr:amidohydrolase family protein [Neisseriaceae bacterium]
MSTILLQNGAVLHPEDGRLTPAQDVLVSAGIISQVGPSGTFQSLPADTQTIAVNGQTIMPGLIDCHVHVMASHANLGLNAALPSNLITIKALPILRGMLYRGFTTVRDAGGADWAIAQAIEQGLIPGPRLFPSGRALSQTGGHGDYRARGDILLSEPCTCCIRSGAIARVVDGVDNVRLAAREEIQMGATQIKIMASGGVSSPTDPINNTQYSEAEIRAIVAEAEAVGTYVMAHAYTAKAIKRAVAFGVRTIEHGNLVDRATADFMHAQGAMVVPTQVTYEMLAQHGADYGLPPESVAKIEQVRTAGLAALRIYAQAGVPMAFGSDLLGEMHAFQAQELSIRAAVLGNAEAIRQATTVAAQVLQQVGTLGCIQVGATADILVVNGNPLDNIDCLVGRGEGERLSLIMQGGQLVKHAEAR